MVNGQNAGFLLVSVVIPSSSSSHQPVSKFKIIDATLTQSRENLKTIETKLKPTTLIVEAKFTFIKNELNLILKVSSTLKM